MSYGYIKKLEAQLQGDVKKLMALAEAADNEKIPEGINLPAEIARREDRLTAGHREHYNSSTCPGTL